MISRKFSIAAPDGKKIYGRIDQGSEVAADKVLVIAHGLAGNPEEFLHVQACRYFTQRGYDVARIRFYSREPEGRFLHESTFHTHALDLAKVIGALRRDYKKCFVAGHSSGGLVTMIANPPVAAISLWEPAFIKIFFLPHAAYIPELDCYSVGRGAQFLIGKDMVVEARGWEDKERSLKLARSQKSPVQLIVTERAEQEQHLQLLRENLPQPSDFYAVRGADHLFTMGNVAEDLLEHTYAWFEKF